MTPVTVALVAVASSLVTVGAIELLRDARSGSPPALAVESRPSSPTARASRAAEPLGPATSVLDQPPDQARIDDRLVELERRMVALELGSGSRRAPVTSPANELPAQDELRDLVLDWVAEEREGRMRAEEREEEEELRTEQEFGARFRAFMLKQEHDLTDWQEAKLVEVFLAVQERNEEVEASFNLLTDDPEEVEARWLEFDEWAEQYEREQMGPELYELLADEE